MLGFKKVLEERYGIQSSEEDKKTNTATAPAQYTVTDDEINSLPFGFRKSMLQNIVGQQPQPVTEETSATPSPAPVMTNAATEGSMNAFREAERKLGQDSAIFKMPAKGQTVEPDPGTSKNIIQKIEDSKAWRAVIGNPEEGFGVSDMISDILVANPTAAATSGAGRAISTLAKRLVSPATQQIAKAGTKATQPITQAAEKLSKMTPEVAKTVARKGAGIGTAATGYETIKGATDPEYVNPITKQETFPSQFGASLRGGVGDTMSMFGSAAGWKDMPEVGEKLKETGAQISEGYESKQVPFSWKSVFDPDWYANNLARSIPMTASLIPIMFAAYKGGKKAASLRGFGKYGQVIIASLAGSTASRPVESMLEAAGGYEEAKAMGKSESEADAIAQRIYDENLKLAGLDSAQLALSFMPTPFKATGTLGKVAIAGGKLALVGGTESVEEGYQEAIQARATGQDDRSIIQQIINPTPEAQEAMAIGGIFGLGMGGTGVVTNMMQDIKTNTIANLPNEIMPQVEQKVVDHINEGMTPAEALDVTLDEIAEVPEVQQVIQQATQEQAAIAIDKLGQNRTDLPETVYDKNTGEQLNVVVQTSPEFLVVENSDGQRRIINLEDVSLDSIPNQTSKIEPEGTEQTLQGETVEEEEIGTSEGEIEPVSAEIKVKGNATTAKTERGTKIDVQYAIVSADDVIASHSTTLQQNESYPQELQPRDRGRMASEMQINKIVNNLEPEFLGENPKASEGAPIVGNDMVVESGNGRIIALKRIYEKSHANAEKYKQWLMDNAEKFGLNKTDIESMDRPVLVRVRTSEVNRADFVKEANEQSVAAMSATEQAFADAEKLTPALLSLFNPSENGDILALSNRTFNGDFLNEVIGPTEQGRYLASDSSISQEGVNRIRNAIFAKAYENVDVLEKLAESTHSNIKNLISAMLIAAPKFVKIKEGIRAGNLYELDITPEIADAAKKLSQLREEGTPVEDYLNQTSMFEEELLPLTKDILEVYSKYKSIKRYTELFNGYIDGVTEAGDPNQGALWGENKPPTKEEVLQAALIRMEGKNEIPQTTLFGNETVNSQKTGKADEGKTGEAGSNGTERKVNFKLDNDSYPATKKIKTTGFYWSEFDHKGKPDLAVVGADKILKDGLTDFNSWSESMVKDHGVDVEGRLDVLWRKANGVANFITKKEADAQRKANRTGKDYSEKEQAPSGITYESASKAERQKWYDEWKTVSSEAGDDNLQTGRGQGREGRGISDTTGDYSTDSPEFKAWFGDSKVVDENGKPLVVYHGTNSTFDEFSPSYDGRFGGGIYFTDNPQSASEYATEPRTKSKFNFNEPAPQVIPVYLKMLNPWNVNELGDPRYSKKYEGLGGKYLWEEMKADSYDGIIYDARDTFGTYREYIVFSSKQVKSVNNQGTWGSTNPDIRFKSDSVNAIAKDLNLTPAPEAMEQEIFQAANTLSQIFTGNDIVTFKGKGIQGMADGDQIYLNQDAKDPVLYVAKHEIVHTLETTDPVAYKRLMNLVRRYYNGNPEMLKHYRKQKYTKEEAWGEFTGDVISEVMEQPGFWKMVRENAPKVIKAVVDVIDQIISKFKKAVAKEDSMLKYIDDIEAFKAEVAGVVAESLSKPKRKGIFDLRTESEIAAKNKKGSIKNSESDKINPTGNTNRLGDKMSKSLQSTGISNISWYKDDNGYIRLWLGDKGSFGYFDTKDEAMSFAKKHRDTLAKYQHEENMDEDTPDNIRYISDAIRQDYADYERSKSKRTSINAILENLEQYRREDLESLAEQYGQGNWDGYEELPDTELVDALRESLEEVKSDMSPLEAQSPKNGYYVRAVKEKRDVRYSKKVDQTDEAKNVKLPKRYSLYGVGKDIGGKIYLHKQYEDVLPEKTLANAKSKLPADFEYTGVAYDRATGQITFTYSPDFDSAHEPTVGKQIVVKPDGSTLTIKQKDNPQIWHHKWLWVKDDYAGFDVEESKNRSEKWLAIPNVDKTRIGYKGFWESNVVPLLETADYSAEEIKIANATSRNAGAVGAKAITPKYVANTATKGETILDFGAGKAAAHAQNLQKQGYNVTAYEFGSNIQQGIHDPAALERQYDTVYASNVLNVQSSENMLKRTLQQIYNSVKNGGRAVFNYPGEPRKAGLTPKRVAEIIKEVFGNAPVRVGGSSSAPLWEVIKGETTPDIRYKREGNETTNLFKGIGTQVSKAKKGKAEEKKFTLPEKYSEVGERIEGSRGVPQDTVRANIAELWDEIKRKGHREFEHLPRTGEFSELRNALLNLRKQKGISADKTLRVLDDVTKPLNEYEYDVFSHKVIFDDLAHEFEEGNLLPFGLTEENFEDINNYINEEAAKLPKVQEAVNKRKQAWQEIKNQYTKAMREVGFNVEDRLRKEDYYHHQVLEYANAKGVMGAGKKLRIATGRGFLKQRGGSSYDINSDYLQAEFEVMAQMLLDAAAAKTVKVVKQNHDIVNELKKEAIRLNDEAMLEEFRKLLDIAKDAETTPEQLYRRLLNKKQAIAFGDLYKLAAKGELPEGPNGKYQKLIDEMAQAYDVNKKEPELPENIRKELWQYLNYLAGNEHDNETAKIVARTIFKGRAEKIKKIKNTLGRNYVTWEDLIPEGYTLWQPREGHMFFMATTIPQGMAEQLFYGIMDEMNLNADMLKKEMVVGQKYPEMVVKEEVALTLEELYSNLNKQSPIAKYLYFTPYRAWKQWQLISPRRYFRYNARNMTGDIDAVIAGNPSALRPANIKKAWQDLWNAFFTKKQVFSKELYDWFERGGFETLMQAQEINDINRNRQFKHLMEKRMQQVLDERHVAEKSWDLVKAGWYKYWDFARTTTDFREAFLRYACYLDYLSQIEGNNGKPKNWGASNRDEIMALADNKNKAAKMANELLGAYDEVSVIGVWLAEHMMPFWRWNEVNFVRYRKLLRNAVQDGKLMATLAGKTTGLLIRSPYIAWKVGKFVLMASALSMMINLWNWMFFRDEDKELPEDVRSRLHIVFGRDKDGNILYFSRLGALQDFLDWFGLDTPIKHIQDYLSGRKGIAEVAIDIAKNDPNKLVNAVTPFIKTPVELLTGKKMYPDVFEMMPVRDRWQYLAESFGLGSEYKALTGKPTRGYASSIPSMFIYVSDPYETAYYANKENLVRYRKKIGTYTEGYSENQRSEALYNVKLAMRYGDRKAFEKYMLEYAALGGTEKGLKQSLKSMHPLYGLSQDKWQDYVDSLDGVGKENLVKALDYYERVIGGNMFAEEESETET